MSIRRRNSSPTSARTAVTAACTSAEAAEPLAVALASRHPGGVVAPLKAIAAPSSIALTPARSLAAASRTAAMVARSPATNKRPAPGLIHRSDRGSQFCAHDYRKLVEQFGMQVSMSRKGNCDDNVPIESFLGSPKNELVHHQRYPTRADAQASIQEYIESFYNRQRRHSRLGNIPPALFAESFIKQPQAA
jgi:transposase InsO family protein